MKNDEQYVNEIFQKYNKIQNTKDEKLYKKNIIISPVNAFFKTIAVILSWITLTGCVAYATGFVIDKVFKEPKVMTYQESISVNEEEKKELITEDQAKEFALKELKDRFNKIPGIITKTELRKDYISYEPRWILYYDNQMSVELDALTGEIKSLTDFSIDDTKVPSTLNKEEAKNVAIDLLKSIGYDGLNYELADFKSNMVSDDANLYTADFSKKYNNIYNPYQTIRLTFIPEEKQIVTFNWFNYEFDNNEIIITNEQAVEIAKSKENELDSGKFKISDVNAKLEIVKMNDYVYSQEKPIDNTESENKISDFTKIVKFKDENNYEVYVIEPKTRLAWNVQIKYESDFDIMVAYYVDATTGELIGGTATK